MCKYDFRKAKFMQDTYKGYWVKLYLITNGINTFTLFNRDDWMDNMLLMSESEYVQCFTKDILVTPTAFSHIFKEIEDFEKCVLTPS